MIDCPECMEPIRGTKCACGYVVPRSISFPTGRTTRPETELTEYSRRWLDARGIHKPGMTREEKTRANLAYIKSLYKTPKPDPREWAHLIMADIDDGVYVTAYAAACAREAVGAEIDARKAA